MKIIETSIRVADYEKVCCNCRYFEQHYVYVLNQEKNKLFLCNAGYCTKAHIRSKKAISKACERFKKEGSALPEDY